MPSPWIIAAIPGVVILALVLLMSRRREVIDFANDREEQLTRKLAQLVGCDLAQALPSVRKELELAPGQSDETLLKRAAYHYRRDMPEKTCSVWRDRTPG